MKMKALSILFVSLIIGIFLVSHIPQLIASSEDDWWPMFHHDYLNTGYSLSSAPETNNLLWTFETNDRIGASAPAIVDGRVYVGSRESDKNMYCLDINDGSLIWKYETDGGIRSSPTISDNRIYFGSMDNNIYCLNAITGEYIWSYQTGSEVFSGPLVYEGQVYVGSLDNNFYCLDASGGGIVWTYQADGSIGPNPAIFNDNIYFISNAGTVYCLNALTSNLVWKYETCEKNEVSAPTIYEGKVYFGCWDLNVYCLDAYNGSIIWRYKIASGGNRGIDSTPAVVDGKIYICCDAAHKLFCLDAYNGSIIWDFDIGARSNVCAPAVADGKVYVGSEDYNVYCVDADDGSEIWHYKTGGKAWNSPAIADGKVVVGSFDNKIYCFGESSGDGNGDGDGDGDGDEAEGDPLLVITLGVSSIAPFEESTEQTIPITVYCYNHSASNVQLEILEDSNLTVTLMSPSVDIEEGNDKDLLVKIKVPGLVGNMTMGSRTVKLRVVCDEGIISNVEQLNIKIVKKGASITPGFEMLFTFFAIFIVLFFIHKRKNKCQ